MHKRSQSSLVFLLVLLVGCANPAIHSFSVSPLTISETDTVRVNWEVSGTPTLLINNIQGQDSATKYMQLTLVVAKGDRQVSQPIQVSVVNKAAATDIVFATVLVGDTLVATGEKNEARWGDKFVIGSISSTTKRLLVVEHAGRKTVLPADGSQNRAMLGTPVKGIWTMKTALTAAEKQDMSRAPETLEIHATIIQSK